MAHHLIFLISHKELALSTEPQGRHPLHPHFRGGLAICGARGQSRFLIRFGDSLFATPLFKQNWLELGLATIAALAQCALGVQTMNAIHTLAWSKHTTMHIAALSCTLKITYCSPPSLPHSQSRLGSNPPPDPTRFISESQKTTNGLNASWSQRLTHGYNVIKM